MKRIIVKRIKSRRLSKGKRIIKNCRRLEKTHNKLMDNICVSNQLLVLLIGGLIT